MNTIKLKLTLLLILLSILVALGVCSAHRIIKSDEFIKSRVVKLMGQHTMCSGEQVHSKESGMDYILTASHCRSTSVDGQSIKVITEDGRSLERRIIDEDPVSDLLLLEGIPNMRGLDLARRDFFSEMVRTFTHGHNLDTYITKGVLIQDKDISIPLFEVNTPDDAARCSGMPKFHIESMGGSGGGGDIFSAPPPQSVCVMSTASTVTTAMVVPGSSGGAVVDSEGDIVGVVSAGNGYFSFLVTLFDIKTFLHNY